MDIQIFIIGFIVVILVCMLLKQKESYYNTQAYYPRYYTSGYGDSYPYYEARGYKGPGSYQYPGYGPAFADQKEDQCELGCIGTYKYARGGAKKSVDSLDNCLRACKDGNPYSMQV
jgi:hypothetical protein